MDLPALSAAVEALRHAREEEADRVATLLVAEPSPALAIDALNVASRIAPAAVHHLAVVLAALTRAEDPTGPHGG